MEEFESLKNPTEQFVHLFPFWRMSIDVLNQKLFKEMNGIPDTFTLQQMREVFCDDPFWASKWLNLKFLLRTPEILSITHNQFLSQNINLQYS